MSRFLVLPLEAGSPDPVPMAINIDMISSAWEWKNIHGEVKGTAVEIAGQETKLRIPFGVFLDKIGATK